MALKQGNGTQTGWCCKATLQQVHSCPIPCLVPMSHQGCSMSHRVHLFSCPLCRDRNLLSLQRGALFGCPVWVPCLGATHCVSCPSPSTGGVGLRPARWGCAGGRRFICPPLFPPSFVYKMVHPILPESILVEIVQNLSDSLKSLGLDKGEVRIWWNPRNSMNPKGIH